MKWKTSLATTAIVIVALIGQAHALDYTIEAPSAGTFAAPTSDDTIYVNTENPNVDRSKNAALIPPSFGTATSYLPGSGEPLTPNLVSGGSIAIPPGAGGSSSGHIGVTIVPATAYTAATSDLYYSGGYLATLKIPALGLNVNVYQGTDSAQLAKGVGHFPDTSIWDGNVAIAAHNRGVNSYFGQIHTLREGNTITLTTKLGIRTYCVTEVFKISETDTSMLTETSDNCITLITCVRDQSEYRWCVRAVAL